VLDLKRALASGEVLIGAFAESGSPIMVEMMGFAGLDFVVIDCEHGPLSPYGGELENVMRAAWAASVCPIVRVTWNDPGQILKAVDMGATAVIVPHVNTAEEAARAVSAASYPPKGRRGAAPLTLASRRGFERWPAYYKRSLDSTIVIPLIEEEAGVEAIDEIVAVPGVGAIFFGPFDLAVSMGAAANAFDSDVADEQERVYAAARSRGLPVFDLAWEPASALAKIRAGAQAVALGADITLFAEACRGLAAAAGEVKSAASTQDGRRPGRRPPARRTRARSS
jgi:4-hydroxy-2-oxoheptanedioate aldolase